MRDGQPVTDGLWWLLWLPVLAISTPAALLLFAMSLELLERRLLGNDIARGRDRHEQNSERDSGAREIEQCPTLVARTG
jgi:hypothetical protein